MSRPPLWRIFFLAAFLTVSLAAFSAQEASDDPAKALPDGDGKDIVSSTCQQCHGLELTTQARHTLDEWRSEVKDMVANGATLDDDQVEIVSQYLAKNFGPEKTGKKEEK